MSASPPTSPEAPSDRPTGASDGGARGAGWPTGVSLVVLTVVVVAALAAPAVAALAAAALGADDSSAAPPSRGPGSSAPSAPPSSSASSPSQSGSASGGRVTCWDGSSAAAVTDCSEPTGAAGLTYVFPSIADQRCGRPTRSGPAGTELRRVCQVRLDGGGRAVVVYTQWQSTAAAVAYTRSKGLRPARGRGAPGLRRFATPSAASGPAKAAAVYRREPFGYIVTFPAGTDPLAAAGQAVRAQPADQVRGSR